MGYNTETTAAPSSNQNTDWKSQGFLNFYLPGKDGKKDKLGAIGLKLSRTSGVNEKQLIQALNKDPSLVAKILASLTIEYRSADQPESEGFKLA